MARPSGRLIALALAVAASGSYARLIAEAGGAKGYLDVVTDCGADSSGASDSTSAIQSCLGRSYLMGANASATPVFFPVGTYLVSAPLAVGQTLGGADDGINVVPTRYLAVVLFGSTAALPQRPVIRLAPNAPGFSKPSGYTPVLSITPTSGCGDGCTMNDIVRGIDFDLSAAGNPSAVGLSMKGAQGAVAQDITVRAAQETFACFQGCNGAGGQHANVACYGARVGIYIDAAQPVPSLVGATLVNQSESAITFFAQETASFVGVNITLAPGASGPAISSPNFAGGGSYSNALSLQDIMISCPRGSAGAGANVTAVASQSTVYARDLWVQGCDVALAVKGAAPVPGAGSGGSAAAPWLHVQEYAKGVNSLNPYLHYDVVYLDGARLDGYTLSSIAPVAPGAAPPSDLLSRHLWDELSFPAMESTAVANARDDCGAAGDDATDDWQALQTCVNAHAAVYLPPGIYRLSRTLRLPPGAALVGLGNVVSVLAAATTGLAGASPSSPQPLLATSAEDAASAPTILAFVGVTVFQHLPDTYALDWASRNPASLWRVGFESRPCECLWTSVWQQLSPPAIPCKLPVNLTIPKTVFRGLGRVHSWVSDDTGSIVSTGAAYRSMRVADTAAFAGPSARTSFYSLNLEHAQSEANGDVINASFVDIHSLKSEGNLPLLWVRAPAANVTVLALGGGMSAFPYNFTFPPDFTPGMTASMLRADEGTGVTFASLIDHGYGSQAPYWPPNGGGCHWNHRYPYPGEPLPTYPFGTWPNATMWNCWFGTRTATAYWHQIVYGTPGQQQNGTQPMDKPALYRTTPGTATPAA